MVRVPLEATLAQGTSRFHLVSAMDIRPAGLSTAARYITHVVGVWNPSERTLAAELTVQGEVFQLLASRSVVHFRPVMGRQSSGDWQRTRRDDETVERLPWQDPAALLDMVTEEEGFSLLRRATVRSVEADHWGTDWSAEVYGESHTSSVWTGLSGVIARVRNESSVSYPPQIRGRSTLDLFDFGVEWKLVAPRSGVGDFVLP